ncbi:MAG: radical SAM protein [Actinomycetota bacterium]|nr:radical SAM protein [Actinomycetota bacterium]
MSEIDVVLINPPTDVPNAIPEEHLGLAYIGACLKKKDISFKIMDFRNRLWTIPQAIDEIQKFSFKIAGITVSFQDEAKKVFAFISNLKEKNSNAHINIGGIFPSFSYEEILKMFPAIDSVTLGEGEITFIDLAESIINEADWRSVKGIAYNKGNKIIKNDIRPSIDDLDSLPFPERYVLNQRLNTKDIASMITSRGCYARCSFCSVVSFYSNFGPKFRFRSSKNVIEEIDLLYNKYGIRNIFFNDANFILGKGKGYRRVIEISDEILKRGLDLQFILQCRVNDVEKELFTLLKKAGLRGVFLGIESGSQSVLDRFKKDTTVEQNLKAMEILSKLNLYTVIGFIPFDYSITFDELNENALFIEKIKKIMPKDKLRYSYLTKVLPYAGTAIEKEMKENKIYKGSSIKFSYKIKDPRINLIYNTAKGVSNIVEKIKRKLHVSVPESYNDWTKRIN